MTDADLKRWEELAAGATAPPWRWTGVLPPEELRHALPDSSCFADNLVTDGKLFEGEPDWVISPWLCGQQNQEVLLNLERSDATFIAAAREAVPALISEVRRLREALRPFARFASTHAEFPACVPLHLEFGRLATPDDLTLGHCRAAEAIAPTEVQDDPR